MSFYDRMLFVFMIVFIAIYNIMISFNSVSLELVIGTSIISTIVFLTLICLTI